MAGKETTTCKTNTMIVRVLINCQRLALLYMKSGDFEVSYYGSITRLPMMHVDTPFKKCALNRLVDM